jgi:5-methyltetrahydropteroyltriglutamate--homocysteine methyltransferase
MTALVGTTLGCYPLPDWAKHDLADRKGHQKEDLVDGDESDAVESTYDDARSEVVTAQQDADLDRIVEGQLRWDDMLAHPLTVNDAVETRGIVRYYDNNNFYREPVVTEELAASGDVASELEATVETVGATTDGTSDPLQAVLPGPYSLADLATNEHYDDDAEFRHAIADFLASEADAFPSVETLFLLEPSLVEHPPDDDAADALADTVTTVADAVAADVVVQPYWGALDEKTHAHLLDADVDAIGYDFVADHEDNLYNITEYGTKSDVSLGLLDGQNTLVEDPETIRERVDWVDEQAVGSDFETTYVTPNTELFYLPYEKYKAKLDALGQAVSLAEVEA